MVSIRSNRSKNLSKRLFEEREHKCNLCNETISQSHYNLENHFQERHNLKAFDYYKQYVAGLKQFDFPAEDDEENDDDDSEFIEAV